MQTQQEKIPEAQKFITQRNQKEKDISMDLIAETSLTQYHTSEEQKISKLLAIEVIHLEWLNIKQIQNLQVFQKLKILYLQHVDNVSYLEQNKLNRGTISSDKSLISSIKQQFNIKDFNPKQIPQAIQLIDFRQNPVSFDADYKAKVLTRLPLLQMFDGVTVTPNDRFKQLGIFPQKLNTYAAQMRQFYTKRQIQAKIKQQNKHQLINTEVIDEKATIGQLRQTTRKYMHMNKQVFEQKQKQQNDNFKERMQISKKVRSIKQTEQKKRQQKLKQIKQSTLYKQ